MLSDSPPAFTQVIAFEKVVDFECRAKVLSVTHPEGWFYARLTGRFGAVKYDGRQRQSCRIGMTGTDDAIAETIVDLYEQHS